MSKLEVYNRDGGMCFYCGKPITIEEATVEHLLATVHGGNNSVANTTVACTDCNGLAGARSIVEKIKLRDLKRGVGLASKRTVVTLGDIRIETTEPMRENS